MSNNDDTPLNETAEQRARRIEREYQAVLDAAVDAVILIDHRGLVQLVNHAAERLFGYKEEELLGRNVSVLMPQPYRGEHDGYLERYQRTGEPHIIGIGREVTAQRRDGTTFAVDLAVGAIKDATPPRFVGFIRDITVRKNAQEALKRSLQELNAAQEMANVGNYVTYPNGGGENYRSPQLLRIIGLDPDTGIPDALTARSHFLDNSVDPADRPRVAAALDSFDRGVSSFDITYRVRRTDGSIRHVNHIAQVVRNESGRVLRHFGTLHDITEQQRAQDELRQLQERLTHFGRISTMGEMAAGIAHEINQPLTAIATYAQACQRFLLQPQKDEADIVAGLQQIEAQALRAGEVIRRLRSFVRNREVRREPLDPNQLLDDLLLLAQTDTHHHSVHIRLERGENLPQVLADPVQMLQVLLNLVRNGIDAMLDQPHDRREILMRTQLADNGNVEFSVCDRGPGLDKAAQDQLFNPFFTTKPTGTGLGLAISQSIVRAHGGKVWHRPNPAGGACFCFSLPAAMSSGAIRSNPIEPNIAPARNE
ncbi:MAG TPA: PAS domain S-box protein [Steroidobacteraceae bacterium]|nr:PAS domain S-box protein [Steroidobacteraceae bacterium]